MQASAVKKPVRLPRKMSELILWALRDLRKAERSKIYEINMAIYHAPRSGRSTCAVCLAGSVMAMSLGADRNAELYPEDFSKSNWRALHALNLLRSGLVRSAANQLGLSERSTVKLPLTRVITPYSTDPVAFGRDMRALARELAAAGQ